VARAQLQLDFVPNLIGLHPTMMALYLTIHFSKWHKIMNSVESYSKSTGKVLSC